MSTNRRNNLAEVMRMAWQFVKRNGYTMSEALKVAWMNFKLKIKMMSGIAKFYFQKVNGEIREAYGTLKSSLLPPTSGGHRDNPTIQTYFDTEKGEYRCFKVANLMRVC